MEQPFDIVLIGETFDSVEPALESAFVKVAGDADAEGTREAAHDVRSVSYAREAWKWVGTLRLRQRSRSLRSG